MLALAGASQLWGNILGSSTAHLDQQGRDADMLDPSAFFEDEEEEIEEAEAFAANQAGSTGRFSRTGSASSLKDLATTSGSFSAAAVGGGGSGGGAGGVLGLRVPSNPLMMTAPAALGRTSAPAGGVRSNQQQQQIWPGQRTPVPGATAAGTVAGAAAAAVAPLIDLDTSPVKQRPGPISSSIVVPKEAGTGISSSSSSLKQVQQQQQQVSSPVSGHSRSHSAIPAFSYNSSSSSSAQGGSHGGSSAMGSTRPSVLHVRTALAAIPVGPLPLPPQPRNALHPSAQATTASGVPRPGGPPAAAIGKAAGAPTGIAGHSTAKGGGSPPAAAAAAPAALGLEKKAAMVTGDNWPVSSPASTCSSSSYIGVGTQAAAGPADDGWDPFAELVMERRVSVSECGHSNGASAPSSGSGSGSSRGYYSIAGEGGPRQLQDSRLGEASGGVGGSGASNGSSDGFSALASETKHQSRLGRGGAAQDIQQEQPQQSESGLLLTTATAAAAKASASIGYGAAGSMAISHDLLGVGGFEQQQQQQTGPVMGHLHISQQQEVLVGGGLPHLTRSLSLLD